MNKNAKTQTLSMIAGALFAVNLVLAVAMQLFTRFVVKAPVSLNFTVILVWISTAILAVSCFLQMPYVGMAACGIRILLGLGSIVGALAIRGAGPLYPLSAFLTVVAFVLLLVCLILAALRNGIAPILGFISTGVFFLASVLNAVAPYASFDIDITPRNILGMIPTLIGAVLYTVAIVLTALWCAEAVKPQPTFDGMRDFYDPNTGMRVYYRPDQNPGFRPTYPPQNGGYNQQPAYPTQNGDYPQQPQNPPTYPPRNGDDFNKDMKG